MATFIDIPKYFDAEKEYLKKVIEESGRRPHLTVVQVGDDPSSESYIRGKRRDCEKIGIGFKLVKLLESISRKGFEHSLLKEISLTKQLNGGLIVQRPLPDYSYECSVKALVPSVIDVDGFGSVEYHYPCTPQGIIDYLTIGCEYKLEGKKALVIGRSETVGRPLADMLTDLDATVTLAHSKTPYKVIEDYVWESDIVFTAINKIEYFDWPWYLAHQNLKIIDIGLGLNPDGKLRGNLTESTIETMRKEGCEVISGTGGVGLLTRLSLLQNVVRAYDLQHEEEEMQDER